MEEQPKKAMELPGSTDENSELRGTTKKAMVWSAQKVEGQPKKAMVLPSSTGELRGTTKKVMVWSAQMVEGQPKKAMVLPSCTGGTSGSRENWGTPKKAMGRSLQLVDG